MRGGLWSSDVARRPRWTAGLAVGGSAATVVGAFLPWAASGRTERNSFELFAVAGRIGVLPRGSVASLAGLWPLLPLVASVALVALLVGLYRVAAVLFMGCSVATVVATSAVASSPLAARPGLAFATGAALVAALGAVVLFVRAPRSSVGAVLRRNL